MPQDPQHHRPAGKCQQGQRRNAKRTGQIVGQPFPHRDHNCSPHAVPLEPEDRFGCRAILPAHAVCGAQQGGQPFAQHQCRGQRPQSAQNAAPYLSGFSAVGFRCRGIQQQGGAQQRQPDWGKAFVQPQCKTQADHCAAGTGQAAPPAAQQVRQCQRQCQRAQQVAKPNATLVGIHQNFAMVGPQQQPCRQQLRPRLFCLPPCRRVQHRGQQNARQHQAEGKKQLRPKALVGHDSGQRLQQPHGNAALAQKFSALLVGGNGKVVHIHGRGVHGVAVPPQNCQQQHTPQRFAAGQPAQVVPNLSRYGQSPRLCGGLPGSIRL